MQNISREKVISLSNSLNTILLGKEDKIFLIISAFLTGGNVLLEDMPGVGKTVVAKAFAHLITDDNGELMTFSRIQGTPDLLPYDITGVDVYDPDKKEFIFKKGPVFTDILLADELNRTTPKVQSALLQAMAEREVSVGNNTYLLSKIFFVIATQNPVESEGTYPLPAAQLDRFSIRVEIGYPDEDHEFEILKVGKSEPRLEKLVPILTFSDIMDIREEVKLVTLDDKLLRVITSVAKRTRQSSEIKIGLSTRAVLMMSDMLKAYAYMKGREFVDDQDLIDLSIPVWAHRILMLNPNVSSSTVIDKITRDEVRRVMNILH